MGAEEAILLDKLGQQYTVLIEYDASSNPVYVGEAEPGTVESAARWRIKKIAYDGSNNPTAVQWASGTQEFDKVWSQRSTYTYS